MNRYAIIKKQEIKMMLAKILFLIVMFGFMLYFAKSISAGIIINKERENSLICKGYKSITVYCNDNIEKIAKEDYKNYSDNIDYNIFKNNFIKDTISVNNLNSRAEIYSGANILIPIYN